MDWDASTSMQSQPEDDRQHARWQSGEERASSPGQCCEGCRNTTSELGGSESSYETRVRGKRDRDMSRLDRTLRPGPSHLLEGVCVAEFLGLSSCPPGTRHSSRHGEGCSLYADSDSHPPMGQAFHGVLRLLEHSRPAPQNCSLS